MYRSVHSAEVLVHFQQIEASLWAEAGGPGENPPRQHAISAPKSQNLNIIFSK